MTIKRVNKNGRFGSSSHRKTFGYSLKRGFINRKDYKFYYKYFKGKGF